MPLQILAAGRIELALHQRVHQVDHGDIAAAHLQAARRFQAQQAAADDHGFQPLPRLCQQRLGIVEGAEDVDVLLCRRPESAE